MSTALQIVAAAYRQVNLDQDLTSFSTSQEFPYNIGLDICNTVIQEMNRAGYCSYQESQQLLPFSAGSLSIDMYPYSIDPKRIIRLRRELNAYAGELIEVNWRTFQRRYRSASTITGLPVHWSKFNTIIQTDVVPDQDYQLTLYYYQNLPLIYSEVDGLPIPVIDEDIVREGVFAYLLMRMGRPEANAMYQLYRTKLQQLLAEQKRDAGLPRQMPASF